MNTKQTAARTIAPLALAVSREMRVPLDVIGGRDGSRQATRARHLLMGLILHHHPDFLERFGGDIMDRDPSTWRTAAKATHRNLKADPDLRRTVARIEEAARNPSPQVHKPKPKPLPERAPAYDQPAITDSARDLIDTTTASDRYRSA